MNVDIEKGNNRSVFFFNILNWQTAIENLWIIVYTVRVYNCQMFCERRKKNKIRRSVWFGHLVVHCEML